MRFIFALIIAWLLPLSAIAAGPTSQATATAEHWLTLIDTADYAKSYEETSGLFKLHVTADQWVAASKSAREPLGALLSRKEHDAKSTHTMPGAPDGDYVVIHFATSFAHKAHAVETVTMMRDGGSWKAAGYFIK